VFCRIGKSPAILLGRQSRRAKSGQQPGGFMVRPSRTSHKRFEDSGKIESGKNLLKFLRARRQSADQQTKSPADVACLIPQKPIVNLIDSKR